MAEAGVLRIGELSRRSGVSPELLRAWERRYGLLAPQRSDGGLRLYSELDVERVRTMQRHLAEGLAAAEAARLAGAADLRGVEPAVSEQDAQADLATAFAAFDEPRAHAVLDGLLSATTLDTAMTTVLLPYLRDLGDRWQRGDASVAEEHFASSVLRGRLLGLAREWGRGLGPRALLACAPGEQHDLGLIAFGLALGARGWRIGYLGADTPIESVANAAAVFAPDFVVVSAVTPDHFHAHVDALRKLARAQRLCLGGSGAAGVELEGVVVRLSGDPVVEAERLTEMISSKQRQRAQAQRA